MATILIAEDDHAISDLVAYNLERAGHTPLAAYDGLTALDVARRDKPELILLDQMMPGMDGHGVLRELRRDSRTQNIPVIFLTAKDTENDMLTGFNLGADDYISKPFSIRQVVARVKAVLRRTSDKEKVPENECLKYETLSLDTKRIKASVDGQEVPLTKKEFEILKLLLENKGNVFSREEILSRIWKDEVYVLDRTIDVNITRLRKKIGPYGKNIVTRLGFGYCFEN